MLSQVRGSRRGPWSPLHSVPGRERKGQVVDVCPFPRFLIVCFMYLNWNWGLGLSILEGASLTDFHAECFQKGFCSLVLHSDLQPPVVLSSCWDLLSFCWASSFLRAVRVLAAPAASYPPNNCADQSANAWKAQVLAPECCRGDLPDVAKQGLVPVLALCPRLRGGRSECCREPIPRRRRVGTPRAQCSRGWRLFIPQGGLWEDRLKSAPWLPSSPLDFSGRKIEMENRS